MPAVALRALPVLLLAACAPPNRVDGLIGGVEVPVVSSFLQVVPGAFGEDDLLVATLSSLTDSCGAERLFEQQASTATTSAELAAAWATAYPPAFWQVDVVARVPGGTWPVKGTLWTGLAWDAFPEAPNAVFATFTDHVALRDEAWWDGSDEVEVERVWFSNAGTTLWKGGTPGQHVRGRFNTYVADGEGTIEGRVEVVFDANICPLAGGVPAVSARSTQRIVELLPDLLDPGEER